ncbi:MAG: hypothetical protein HZA46_18190 [Planctomycetales bacterium]|nr:hypothetical protein [Planctomycetales bacterium]
MQLLITILLCQPFAEAQLVDAQSDPTGILIGFRQTASHARDFSEIRESERTSYFQLLAGVRQLGYTNLWALSKPLGRSANESQFARIFEQPKHFRGEVVRICGYVRELSEWDASDDNEHGLTTLYQAWVFTEDSFRNPYVIVCSEVSPELRDRIRQQGKAELKEPVEVAGVFFKIWKYDARDGTRGAPMILAHRLTWKPVTETQSFGWLTSLLVAVVALIVLPAIVFAIRSASRKDREFRRTHLQSPPLFDQVVAPQPIPTAGADHGDLAGNPGEMRSSRDP